MCVRVHVPQAHCVCARARVPACVCALARVRVRLCVCAYVCLRPRVRVRALSMGACVVKLACRTQMICSRACSRVEGRLPIFSRSLITGRQAPASLDTSDALHPTPCIHFINFSLTHCRFRSLFPVCVLFLLLHTTCVVASPYMLRLRPNIHVRVVVAGVGVCAVRKRVQP